MKHYSMIILPDETKVDSLMRLAANHNVHCLYKIGVYGHEQQHELYIQGSWLNRFRFKRAMEFED